MFATIQLYYGGGIDDDPSLSWRVIVLPQQHTIPRRLPLATEFWTEPSPYNFMVCEV